MKTRTALLALVVGLALAGCVMPEDVSRMQRQIQDVQQTVRQVQVDQDDTARHLEDLELRSDESDEPGSREELADLALRIEQVSRQMAMSDERLNELSRRLDRYSQELQQTRELARRGASGAGNSVRLGPSVGTGPMPTPGAVAPRLSDPGGALPDPEALYNTAYSDFSKGNFALAISGFTEYQERFPDSALADNALYWIAECHFSQADYPAATLAVDRLLTSYPSSDKAPAADLKKALAFLEQNRVSQAIVQLKYVVSRYPSTDESRIARDKLSSLGASPG